MDITEIEKLFEIVEQIDSSKEEIRKFVMDEKNDYNERLTVWFEVPEELMPTDDGFVTPPGFENLNWCEDFYKLKGETFYLRDIAHELYEDKSMREKLNIDPDQFVEACMNAGYFMVYNYW